MMQSLLDQAVFSQPLPALIALLMVVGLFFVGDKVSKLYFGIRSGSVENLAGFVVAVLFIGFLSDLFLHSILGAMIFNILAVVLVLLGLLQLYQFKNVYVISAALFQSFSAVQRYQIGLAFLILFFLLLSALAPPTDADSLDYHLGAPLVWLFNGGYDPLEPWYHARLTGLGERVILFGLLNGTDVLSAVLQWSGLLIAIASLFELSKRKSNYDLILSFFLVLSAPVIIFMVLNQKPYLFPVASVALGIALLLTDRAKSDISRRLPVSLFLILSVALYKYSFLLSVSGVAALFLIHAYRNSYFNKIIVLGATLALLILVPYYLRNYIYYGDPFSPLLSGYIDGSEPVLTAFSNYLRIGYYPSIESIIKIPFDQGIFPSSIGRLSTVVGVGGVGILAAFLSKRKEVRLLMLTFALMFALVVFLGRPISRYMFDIYLVGAMGLLLSELDRFKRVLSYVLSVQAIVVLVMSSFSAYILFPGVLSDNQRQKVMTLRADGYDAGKKLDAVLPADAVLLTDIRSKILIPRDVVFADNFQYAIKSEDVKRLILGSDRYNSITHVAIGYPITTRYKSILLCSKDDDLEILEIRKATRNPLNQANIKMVVFELDRSRPDCFLESPIGDP